MKTKVQKLKCYAVEAVCFLYILLFTYASVSKILDFVNFQAQIGQSPLLSPFAGLVSYGVLIVELVIAILIAIPVTRNIGLYSATGLMAMFTAYIFIILNYSSFVPCSCGGILEEMTWKEHMIFNLFFVAMGSAAIILISMNWRKAIAIVIITAFSGVALITAAFLLSEDIMAKENPFIRRFPQGTAAKTASVNIKYFSAYIAGVTNGRIYLANRKAPLQILEYGTDLKYRNRYTIKLNRENFNFQSVQVTVVFPYFYVYDGNVPVIYKGLISDWKASVLSDRKFSFIDIAFASSMNAIIRSRAPKTGENILASISGDSLQNISYNPRLLQKQFDGVFDTDGTLQYSHQQKKLIYTYFYRNQYIVANNDLSFQSRNYTIDTTSKAKLKIVKLSSGDSKLAAPPHTVNKRTTVYSNLLFVNSMLRGRFESANVWKDATAVDVYDINKNIYLLSFYVYDEDEGKMTDFFATDSALYIISGNQLLKYGFGQRIKSKMDKSIPAGSRTEIENL